MQDKCAYFDQTAVFGYIGFLCFWIIDYWAYRSVCTEYMIKNTERVFEGGVAKVRV